MYGCVCVVSDQFAVLVQATAPAHALERCPSAPETVGAQLDGLGCPAANSSSCKCVLCWHEWVSPFVVCSVKCEVCVVCAGLTGVHPCLLGLSVWQSGGSFFGCVDGGASACGCYRGILVGMKGCPLVEQYWVDLLGSVCDPVSSPASCTLCCV